MRGIGDQNFFTGISLLLQVRADQQQAGHFAMRSGGGLQRDGIHAGDFQQALFEQPQNLEAALRELLWLIRMLRGNPLEPGNKFVHARVVLHRAGAQRIHPQVNGVVPR